MQINIDGHTITAPDGASISVINGNVYINGAPAGAAPGPELKIEVVGGLASLKVDRGSVHVTGDVAGAVDAGGSVQVGGSTLDVRAGGSVNCGTVRGEVRAGGSVTCGTVGGNVRAAGSVSHH